MNIHIFCCPGSYGQVFNYLSFLKKPVLTLNQFNQFRTLVICYTNTINTLLVIFKCACSKKTTSPVATSLQASTILFAHYFYLSFCRGNMYPSLAGLSRTDPAVLSDESECEVPYQGLYINYKNN